MQFIGADLSRVGGYTKAIQDAMQFTTQIRFCHRQTQTKRLH